MSAAIWAHPPTLCLLCTRRWLRLLLHSPHGYRAGLGHHKLEPSQQPRLRHAPTHTLDAVQVPIAVWAISNPDLRSNRFYGTHPLTHWMLCIAGGFFLHDAVSCLLRESPFYIVHGLTCCLGYTVGAAYGVGHFYGGLFLMWEVSTPFVQLRWVLHKMGRADTTLYKVNGILMVVTFGVARILFGTCAPLCPAFGSPFASERWCILCGTCAPLFLAFGSPFVSEHWCILCGTCAPRFLPSRVWLH